MTIPSVETTIGEVVTTSVVVPTTSDITSEEKVSQFGNILLEHTEEIGDFKETESTAVAVKEVGIILELQLELQ